MSLSALLSKSKSHAPAPSTSKAEKGANLQYATTPHPNLLAPLQTFIHDARSRILTLPPPQRSSAEIECRLGIVQQPFGVTDRRLFSDYSPTLSSNHCWLVNYAETDPTSQKMTPLVSTTNPGMPPNFITGVSHEHFHKSTADGLAQYSPITASLGVEPNATTPPDALVAVTQLTESVYYTPGSTSRYIQSSGKQPVFENKQRVLTKDLAVPSGKYDVRLTLATEVALEATAEVPKGMTLQREKHRHSFTRKDGRFAWQLDVTTVIAADGTRAYEIEMEMTSGWTSKLTSMPDSTTAERESVASTITNLAEQLVWMLDHLSPVESDLDVGQFLHVHKNKDAVNIAQRQCGAIRGYSEGGLSTFNSAVENSHRPSLPPVEKRFVGCMPVSFQRHHLETVQKGDYYVSEKTDGVRYLMVFTGSSAVLLDRTMQGWAPIPSTDDAGGDPFLQLAQCVAPGTVFDGEVVINRKSRRAQFIIFDVLCYGGTCLTRHKFSERLRVLKSNDWLDANNSARLPATSIVDTDLSKDKSACPALPLVRKIFQRRADVDSLLDRVTVDRGLRMYHNGANHQHLTDGIIFQPNLPYVISTDFNLLKWKYLDTATIDVEVSLKKDGGFTFVCDAGDGAVVDMSRYIALPPQELVRLEADRNVTGCKIAEVGFNPIGEWYYKCMRTDKDRSNHISTVMGTLLELAEGISMTEIRVRMMKGADSWERNLKEMEVKMLRAARVEEAGGESAPQNKKRKLDE